MYCEFCDLCCSPSGPPYRVSELSHEEFRSKRRRRTIQEADLILSHMIKAGRDDWKKLQRREKPNNCPTASPRCELWLKGTSAG